MTDPRTRRETCPGARIAVSFIENALQIWHFACHDDLTIAPLPFVAWPIPVNLDAVTVRISQIERLTNQMIGIAFERIFSLSETAQRTAQIGASRNQYCEVIQPCRTD